MTNDNMNIIQDYYNSNIKPPLQNNMKMEVLLPFIRCEDGFEMSVQAGFGYYSDPPEYFSTYKTWEVGYPSDSEDLLQDYYDSDDPDIFKYVPTEIINQIILKHGGLK